MSTGLKRYPAMKDSGVPWLGNVPEHWQVRKLRNLLKPITKRNRPDLPLLSVVREKGVIRRDTMTKDENRNFIPDDLSNYKVVRAGQFAMNKMKAWQGSHAVSRFDGLVSPAYFVFDLSGVASDFFHAAIRSRAYVPFFAQASDGVRIGQWDLSQARMKEIPFLAPPITEQDAIVRFLHNADGRIRRYSRATQTLIKLLEEQQQAIVHHAVTRGLDPNVPLKPSGTPWLGDIPQHWMVSPSRRLFTVRKELSRPDDVQLSSTQAYGVIAQSEFEEKVGRRVVRISMHLEKRRHVERDDFVISMRSFQGGLERAWAQGAIRSSYVVLKPESTVDVVFFAHLFKSHGYIRALQATADFIRDGQDLTYDNFRRVDLPVIPLDEQRAIGGTIARATSEIGASITRLSGELDLLREYRTRLIADVVTGKLDVREVVATLPDEPDGNEASEDEADLDDSVAGMEGEAIEAELVEVEE